MPAPEMSLEALTQGAMVAIAGGTTLGMFHTVAQWIPGAPGAHRVPWHPFPTPPRLRPEVTHPPITHPSAHSSAHDFVQTASVHGARSAGPCASGGRMALPSRAHEVVWLDTGSSGAPLSPQPHQLSSGRGRVSAELSHFLMERPPPLAPS